MTFTNQSQAKKQAGVSYLGSINSSAKIVKNRKVNNYTYVMYLAPANTSGYNVCKNSTPECRMGCLNTSGRVKIEEWGGLNTIKKARITRTRLFFEDQDFFMNWLVAEMKSAQAKAKRDGFYFSARLNGTSDIEWEHTYLDGKTIFEIFPEVQFYDYAKNPARMVANAKLPANYHLTFSYTGKNKTVALKILESGKNVAVIFNTKNVEDFPTTWNGYPVINGDLTDYRPLDGNGVVVALKWKDIANRENNEKIKNSCFVEQLNVQVAQSV